MMRINGDGVWITVGVDALNHLAIRSIDDNHGIAEVFGDVEEAPVGRALETGRI